MVDRNVDYKDIPGRDPRKVYDERQPRKHRDEFPGLVLSAAAASTVITVGMGGGTFDLDSTSIQLSPGIIEVDEANNKFIIKEGSSGVYRFLLYCDAHLISTGAGYQNATAYIEQVSPSTTHLTWNLEQDGATPDSGSPRVGVESSAVVDVFIDASAADEEFKAKYNLTTPYGSGSLELKQMSILLLAVTAVPILPVPVP